MPFTDKNGHLTKASQKEKITTLQVNNIIAERICEQKLESSLSQKVDKFVSVW